MFGLLAPGASRAQADAEIDALVERVAASSPQTHAKLRTNVRPYGGRSPGGTVLEMAIIHTPILLVLVIACVTVGVLIYTRIATRDAEIAMRYALGADRTRILGQLFVEALVLTSAAGLVGVVAADAALRWGKALAYSGQAAPFWMASGLRMSTVFFAMGLALAGAVILGVLPALKATGAHVQSQLQNLGSGGSTLRFGRLWATALIVQVALTVIVMPPAMGIATEGVRDRVIRSRFPVEDFIAGTARAGSRLRSGRGVRCGVRDAACTNLRRTRAPYRADPGRCCRDVRRSPARDGSGRYGAPRWNSAQTRNPCSSRRCGRPLSAKASSKPSIARSSPAATSTRATAWRQAATVIVNEAFARRRFMQGANPIGRRVRYVNGDGTRGAWYEVVGIVRDFNMTPTDLGEAPYIFHAASAGTVAPLVMGVRITGDRAGVIRGVRAATGEVDPRLRIGELQTLDDLAWNADIDGMTAAGSVTGIVLLGLFLAACSIYSLVSVSVARRTREIGLRTALGASPRQVLVSIVSRAGWLVGGGIAVGNAVIALVLIFTLQRLPIAFITRALMITSAVMLTVALLACLSPARRALRIHPTDALRHL